MNKTLKEDYMEKELLKILMLEDIEEDAGLVDRALLKGDIRFIRTRVDTSDQFIEALDEFKPDIILSDHSMPQFNSIEALKICKEKKIDVPFILVTGAVSEEFAVNCLKMGAVDYVLKTNLSRLPQAIQQAIDNYMSYKKRLSQEEALRIQNEELIKINKELDALVYRVSHDLRSPLSSILGLVTVARMDDDKDRTNTKGYFDMIEHNVMRLDETLREILDYYKNARSELVIEKIDIDRIVNSGLNHSKYLKGYEQLKKQVKVEQQADLYTDAYRLLVILINLISNGVKYRDESKVNQFLNISMVISETQALLEIQDNGIGIEEKHQSKIFDMFYRATEKSQGAGLGLYVVKEMIARLNGEIKVTSHYGTGTTIHVFLPNNLN